VIVGAIDLVEGLGVLDEDDIAVGRVGGHGHAAAIAPHILLGLLDRAIGALLIAARLDA